MSILIAEAADHRTMEPSAQIMLLKPALDSTGEHEQDRSAMQMVYEMMFEIFSERTGKATSYYAEKLSKANLYLTAQEALEEDLVDQILPAPTFSHRVERYVRPVTGILASAHGGLHKQASRFERRS